MRMETPKGDACSSKLDEHCNCNVMGSGVQLQQNRVFSCLPKRKYSTSDHSTDGTSST